MTVRLTSAEAEQRIKHVRAARGDDRSNFCALVERAGLDPSKDLRFGNFSGVDFSGCKLAGYDFTGAALNGCGFGGASIVGAIFYQCEFSGPQKHIGQHHMIDAIDWVEAYNDARKSEHLLPSNFDQHITEGVYFKDFLGGPLMQCIIMPDALGEERKYAIEASTEEVSPSYRRFYASDTDASNRDTEVKDWLNAKLRIMAPFKYELHPLPRSKEPEKDILHRLT
jgi:hypothetical protein